MSKVLVTGGAGFIGSHLAEKLIAEGHEVHIWDNFITGKTINIPDRTKFEYVDIANMEKNKDVGFEVIFHLAALARIQPSFKQPVLTHEINVNGTLKILEYARINHAKVIYAGSSSFYHDVHANPYTYTKWMGEEYCRLYNKIYKVPVAIGRFFNVYGPRHLCEGDYATVIGIFERQRRNNEPLTVTGTGEKRRDFTHVHDIVRGLVAMSHGVWNGDIFNLGTGVNYSINEVAKMFNPIDIKYIPERPGEADTTLADYSVSKEKLGYAPRHSLENYISKFLGSL